MNTNHTCLASPASIPHCLDASINIKHIFNSCVLIHAVTRLGRENRVVIRSVAATADQVESTLKSSTSSVQSLIHTCRIKKPLFPRKRSVDYITNKPNNSEQLVSASENSTLFKHTYRQSVFIALIFLFCSGLNAQTLPIGPHQGRLVHTGHYVVEMLGCMDHLKIYLFDKDMHTVSTIGLEGKVQYFGGDKTEVAFLIPEGKDGFTAQMPPQDFASCKITITLSGTDISAEFSNECPINN